MALPEEFLKAGEKAEKQKEAARRYAAKVARSFSEVFGTPNGRNALAIMREHFVGNTVLDRGKEEPAEIIRRDALRDAYLWIEGMTNKGERVREEPPHEDQRIV